MNQKYIYSVVKKGKTITVMYSQDGGVPQALSIFRMPQLLYIDNNKLLGYYLSTGESITLLNDPEHNAKTVLDAVAHTLKSPGFRSLFSNISAIVLACAGGVILYSLLSIYRPANTQKIFSEAPIASPATPPPGLLPSQLQSGLLTPRQEMQEELAKNRKMLPETPTAALRAGNTPAVAITPPAPTHTASTLSPRLQMADVLKRNAARGMFTITLSEGHPRTLYAFLDPTCSVCRQMEPAIEKLAQQYNVIIFPVSVVNDGGDAVKRIIPLLCQQDPVKRAAGWQNTFRADAGMHIPGSPETNEPVDDACADAAEAAIGVNNLGFRQFGFSGTPWVLTDTGFHLPTGMLSQPEKIGLFLDTTDGMAPEQADHFMKTINTEG